jgi:hypothetical protein
MQWKTLLIITSAALLADCASPSTKPIKVDQAANQAEARLQNELALEGLINDELRLKRIASDIKMKASGLCGELVEYDLGVYALSQDMLPRQFREAANALYQIGQKPRVLLVYPGSGSEDAGIKNGDEIVSINNWLLPAGEASAQIIREKSEAFLKDGKPLEVKIARGSEEINLSVHPRKQCAFPVLLNGSDQLNAFADGKNVFIARGMMRFAQDDTELALVVSHEMAHNSMLHMKAKTTNYVLGTVLDVLIAATTGVNTQGGFGNIAASRYSQEFEAEADYVGLYMMAAAGKNIDSAPKFWRRMAAAHPTGIEADYSSSHPSTAYRLLALEETVKEIKLKKETGASLAPEMKKPVPATTTTATIPAASPGATSSMPALTASEAIEGHFAGKASRVGGLAGLVKGIDLKLSFTSKTEKAITRLEGKAKLYADDGEEIGSIPFRSENAIPGASSIELIQTVYPLLFPGYYKIKDLDDSKIRAEFTFEKIEFADGSKAAK